MSAAAVALLLAVGWQLSTLLLRPATVAERAASSLFLAAAAVPLVLISVSLLGSAYLNLGWLVGAAGLGACALAPLTVRVIRRDGLGVTPPRAADWAVLGLAAAAGAVAWLHYNPAEWDLSLGAYLRTGEARCFYMQTFALQADMVPDVPRAPVAEAFTIINTPGNTLFTAPLTPALGPWAFRALYALFAALLFVYVQRLVVYAGAGDAVAAGAGLFAALNPYVLSVEVLDRNVIALACSALLVHTVLVHPRHTWLHGLLLGVTAGTGLRFVPLVFVLPVVGLHLARRTPPLHYLWMALAFGAAFAFNVPHLGHHGLHSLGETEPLWRLAWLAFGEGLRTPQLPYPNGGYYLLHAMSMLGLAACALLPAGVVFLWQRRRGLLWMLLPMALLPYLVLATQRDWVEGEKVRILLSGMLPVFVLLGTGVAYLLSDASWRARLGAAGAGVALAAAGALLVPLWHGTPDEGTYRRKPTYQTASEAYVRPCRHALRPRVLPGYHRLMDKARPGRKRIEGRVIRHALFGEAAPPDRALGDDFVDLSIDLEALVTDPGAAVALAEASPRRFVDLEAGDRLLDVYHREVGVSWQAEPLPVTVQPLRPETAALGELYVDLNAFCSLGTDAVGFVRVNMIHFLLHPERRDAALASAMTALPERSPDPVIVLRVPRAMTVVVRNWLVDGTMGVPHRVDGWWIRARGDGDVRVRFAMGEPESYL